MKRNKANSSRPQKCAAKKIKTDNMLLRFRGGVGEYIRKQSALEGKGYLRFVEDEIEAGIKLKALNA